ncbi:response regulator [Marinilabiliaceae bacterium JC040]|nr:response regulator [Marinilabiliaceae bacterium JC040]
MKILIALTNTTYRNYLAYRLESLHHSVTLLNNGKEVIDSLKKDKYDSILIEDRLEYINGLQILYHIKKGYKTIKNSTKIFIGTSIDNKRKISNAIELGIDGYFIFPIETKEIINRIIN